MRLAAGETLDSELSEEEEEEEESGDDDLAEGERVRFDAPWRREEGGAEEEQGGAIWDRRSFASLADGDEVRIVRQIGIFLTFFCFLLIPMPAQNTVVKSSLSKKRAFQSNLETLDG